MIIVGGSYWETIRHPQKSDLYGSGLKAAMAVSSFTNDLKLISSCSKEERPQVEIMCKTFGIKYDITEREAPIEFNYLTPLTSPRIYGLGNKTVSLNIDAERVLSYGMLEATQKIKAKKLVLDPQKPNQTSLNLNLIDCEETILILNQHEAAELSGLTDVKDSAIQLVKLYKLAGVVIKCGAIGCLVHSSSATEWISVLPSETVWPIGSGDIFSAMFSVAWLEQNKSLRDAAEFASLGVHSWTINPDVFPVEIKSKVEKNLSDKKPRVYLAGPFFNISQLWLVETAYNALVNLGCDVFSPYHEVGLGGDEVAQKDLEGLDNCDSVLALLDGDDAGTIFEVGYALNQGKKTVGFCANKKTSSLKMIRGSGISLYDDLSTAIYKSIWAGMN